MKNILFRLLTFLIGMTVLQSCKEQPAELKQGIWRAVLKTESAAEIPFNFEVIDSAGKKRLEIINAAERFRVDEVTVKGDSVIIQMPLFDSEIRTAMKNGKLYGQWIKHLADSSVSMPFVAQPGTEWRFFNTSSKSRYNASGRWSATFVSGDGQDTTIAVGEFRQEGSKVTGTFLTATGDYRFLEGTVSNNNLYLSCFDGTHAYLFTGKLTADSTITNGKFYSGLRHMENWTAKKDDQAILPDAYSLTDLKEGYQTIDFAFPDLNGDTVSLRDPKFRNKVVIVQFFGSWCPNCMDETAFLAPFHKKYRDRGVEVVGLAYERSTDFQKAKKNIERLKKRFDVEYDLLVTGYSNDKAEVAKSLPMLDRFIAFPTAIILDKKGKVRRIHTGFNGPGTGEHYTSFVKEFESTIENLIKE